jgi:hypothetical protein
MAFAPCSVANVAAAATLVVGLATLSVPASAAACDGPLHARSAGLTVDGCAADGADWVGRSSGRERSAARTGASAPRAGGVFRTSYTLAEFESLTGARLTNTVGDRTYYSYFRDRPTLGDDGFNVYINRTNGRIVFRSLSGLATPTQVLSQFVDTKSKERTSVAFNLGDPQTLLIQNFPTGPVPVSLN